jgi:hypothetical protein
MMCANSAYSLICHEAMSDNGMVVGIRLGIDPGDVRMRKVIEAIKTLLSKDINEKYIRRDIAYSLFALALYSGHQSESWQWKGLWRNGAFNDEMGEIQILVDQYLSIGL